MPRGVYDRKRHELEAARGANPVAAPGRAEVSAPARCGACHWYESESDKVVSFYGNCVRYPQAVKKTADLRCGEFKPKKVVP